ncbi:nuclear transport factor 2 family protein [Pedobacter psychrodurus]|uniref:nuclear transport factor 2 family protein n=1 Tax=Pedobacter psychrodurus TaxID=2530456 RepID=UPI00292D7427|nr:nuclear transport factor 2 family protein [Pedobacter psychrodurus]
MKRTTEEVWKHHCEAFAGVDLEAVMSDFAPDAIYISPGKSILGKENIQALYKQHFENLDTSSTTQITSETLQEGIVLFEWTAESATTRITNGVDTFVIHDGLIVAQTMRCTVEIKM